MKKHTAREEFLPPIQRQLLRYHRDELLALVNGVLETRGGRTTISDLKTCIRYTGTRLRLPTGNDLADLLVCAGYRVDLQLDDRGNLMRTWVSGRPG